jgi:hypothetical protein
LEIRREEIEVKRQEVDVVMKKMEQDRLLKNYDLDMQVYLADLADFREQKKQWLVANEKGWMADKLAALLMPCGLPERPVMVNVAQP